MAGGHAAEQAVGRGSLAQADLVDVVSRAATLAWDAAAAIGGVLPFRSEVVDWGPGYGYGCDQSYCLVFGAPIARVGD